MSGSVLVGLASVEITRCFFFDLKGSFYTKVKLLLIYLLLQDHTKSLLAGAGAAAAIKLAFTEFVLQRRAEIQARSNGGVAAAEEACCR